MWIRLDKLQTYLAGEITEHLLGPAGRSVENSEDAIPLDALPPEEASRTIAQANREHGPRAAEERIARLHAQELEDQAELSNRQREVWKLCYWRDLTPKAVGDRMGLDASTVRVHLHRARKRLQSVAQGAV